MFLDPVLQADLPYGASELSRFYQSISIGYFWYDLILVLKYYPALGGVGTLCHHIFGSIAYVVTLVRNGQIQNWKTVEEEKKGWAGRGGKKKIAKIIHNKKQLLLYPKSLIARATG